MEFNRTQVRFCSERVVRHGNKMTKLGTGAETKPQRIPAWWFALKSSRQLETQRNAKSGAR